MNQPRWDPILHEWVTYATHRQDRTFLLPAEYCPLCPTKPDDFLTEVPRGSYDIVVFENKFPFYARYPYEAHIYARRCVPSMAELTTAETDGRNHEGLAHFHVEFYSPNRIAEKLKYLAGSELGAGAFIVDALPGTTAAKLREAVEKAGG